MDARQSFRKILVRNITLPLITGLISSAVFVLLINVLIKQTQEIEHSDQIISSANNGLKLFIDGETGVRGYLITGSDSFLSPFINSKPQAEMILDGLKKATADNKIQVDRVLRLEAVYANWRTYADTVVKLKTDKKNAVAFVNQGVGKALMDEARDLFDKIIATEERLRKDRSDSVSSSTQLVMICVVVLSLVISILIALYGRKQLFELSRNYEDVLTASEEKNQRLLRQQWLKTGQSGLNEKMVAPRSMQELFAAVLEYVAEYLNAKAGAFYIANSDQKLIRLASIALPAGSDNESEVSFGQTLVGKAAVSKKSMLIKDLPANYLKITSGTGWTLPSEVFITPIIEDGEVLAVLELGFVGEADSRITEFFEIVSESISGPIAAARFRDQREKLLLEIQNQSEELQTQQEELRVTNEELEEQARILKNTQSRLEAQHAEMEQTNEQLEEQARTLETQKDLLDRRNEMLTDAKLSLEQKALELQRASQYKSEFLANMSHELRTPLNSSLILAKLLSENKEGNLSSQQIEFAKQIETSGNDLLNLINDILDLAKVESGKLDIHPELIRTESVVANMRRSFIQLSEEKGLKLEFEIEPEVPEQIFADRLRLEQILKNLLSNAIKFTPKGFVKISVSASSDQKQIHFEVKDSGIGIKPEQQEIIFEAFRQADGTTNRKFGGTGLGLSISRDLSRLMGGSVSVRSVYNEGSSFTLTLPVNYVPVKIGNGLMGHSEKTSYVPKVSIPMTLNPQVQFGEEEDERQERFFEDDRDLILKSDEKHILVVEDDKKFASILYNLAHEQNYKCIVTDTAEEAIRLVKKYLPIAVILDIKLNGQSGLFALDQIKQSAETRHIPVHVISAEDFSRQALHLGAVGYMLKPVKREQLIEAFQKIEEKIKQGIRKVLIVEDNKIQRQAIQQLIGDKSIETIAVETGSEACRLLGEHSFDCMIIDLNLPDMTGFELIEKINADESHSSPPIIVYTGRSLTREEEMQLNKYSHSVIIKGAKSPERLLDEVTLFLHGVESKLDSKKKNILENVRNREKIFDGKTIMIVDDDMRNTFALTAALEQKGAKIVIAKNGEESISKLTTEKDVDLVLMDIMMPVMDGYEATKRIRQNPKFKKLPIIALTAKAMKDDRQLCIEAGANDYLSKPVDLDKLLSLVRIWMSAGWN